VDLPPGQAWQQATISFLDIRFDTSGLEHGKGHFMLGYYIVSMLPYKQRDSANPFSLFICVLVQFWARI